MVSSELIAGKQHTKHYDFNLLSPHITGTTASYKGVGCQAGHSKVNHSCVGLQQVTLY